MSIKKFTIIILAALFISSCSTSKEDVKEEIREDTLKTRSPASEGTTGNGNTTGSDAMPK